MKIHTCPAWIVGRNYAAFTLGKHVFVKRGVPVTPTLLRHERVHVEQFERYGILGFLARYAWWRIRLGYRNNPLEVEAYERQGRQG